MSTLALLSPLDEALRRKASDITLCPGMPTVYRVVDRLQFAPPLGANDFTAIHQLIAPNRGNHDVCSYSYNGERYRIIAYDADDGRTLEIRHLRKTLIPLDELRPPEAWLRTISAENGLIIVTGATGSGKSTTLAATIDHLNQHEELKIITLEDPIEYQHQNRKCLVKQREHGRHFQSYPEAIEASMRQDPDIIVVGELRSSETIDAALTAAATGALVFGTMHTVDAAGAVQRIADAARTSDALSMLATSLRAVLATKLIPALSGGRLAAYELLVSTTAVSNCIVSRRIEHLRDEISRGGALGMVSMDSAIEQLIRGKLITKENGLKFALNRDELAKKTQHLK